MICKEKFSLFSTIKPVFECFHKHLLYVDLMVNYNLWGQIVQKIFQLYNPFSKITDKQVKAFDTTFILKVLTQFLGCYIGLYICFHPKILEFVLRIKCISNFYNWVPPQTLVEIIDGE